MRLAKILVSGLFPLTFASLARSSDNQLDRTLACNDLCSCYADGVDSDYNVGECRNDCRAEAQANDDFEDQDFEDQVDRCEGCLDEGSCTESTFESATPCGSIVR